jgi:hypothetical protein
MPFFSFLDECGYLPAENLWLLFDGSQAVGYAAVFSSRSVLKIKNLLLFDAVDPLAAVAALARTAEAAYVQVRIDRLQDMTCFARAGFSLAGRDWGVFMVKPLSPSASVDQFRALYDLDSDRFLISYMDIT